MNSVPPTKMANMTIAVQLVACLVVLPRSAPAAMAPPARASARRPARIWVNLVILFPCLLDERLVDRVEFAIGATDVDPGQNDGEGDNADADRHTDAHRVPLADLLGQELFVEGDQQNEAVISGSTDNGHDDGGFAAHGDKPQEFRIGGNP